MRSGAWDMASGSTPIEARLEYLEAMNAIIHIEGLYCRTWDSGDAAGWAALFTEDGVFIGEAVGDLPGSETTGRAELQRKCARFHETYRGLHEIGRPDIEIDGAHARSRLHFR